MSLPEVKPILKMLAMSRNRYVHGLDCVPDDRLTWSPGGEARSPLGLADYTVGFLGFVTHLITHKAFPESRPQVTPSETREEAKERLNGVFTGLISAVQGLTEEDMDATIPVPWGESRLGDFLAMTAFVSGYAQGQMNYCQLAYGDKGANIPSGWGKEEC